MREREREREIVCVLCCMADIDRNFFVSPPPVTVMKGALTGAKEVWGWVVGGQRGGCGGRSSKGCAELQREPFADVPMNLRTNLADLTLISCEQLLLS